MRSDLVRICFQDEKEVSPLNRFVPCCSHVWTNREDGEPLNKRGKKKVQHLDRIVASCLAPHTIVACLLDCLLACLLACLLGDDGVTSLKCIHVERCRGQASISMIIIIVTGMVCLDHMQSVLECDPYVDNLNLLREEVRPSCMG